MNRILTTLALCAGLGLAGCAAAPGNSAPAPSTSPQSPASTTSSSTAGVSAANTAEVVNAAAAFLTTLSEQQRQSVVVDFSDPARKSGWSNLPNILFPRPGVVLGELDSTQRQAAMGVLEAALSDDGYQEVQQILLSDDYLARVGTVEGGTPPAIVYGSGYYNLAFFGEPSEQSPFTLQFGGHHVAHNITYADGNVSMAPEHIGVEPPRFDIDGTTYQPMADESSSVLALVNGLTEEQRSVATLPGAYDDLLLGAQTDGPFPAEPQGQLVSELNPQQQDAVTAVVRAWVGDIDDQAAEALIARYTSEYDRTYVGWAGGTTLDVSNTYVRVDGPSLWIEFSNQPALAVEGFHHHTIYRDETADYGGR